MDSQTREQLYHRILDQTKPFRLRDVSNRESKELVKRILQQLVRDKDLRQVYVRGEVFYEWINV